ncbi:MAG: flagellar hook-length control protein FliK, partial [Liquorilactobacillus nagelii]|uniref:flagellar hook-length control protein FliK n=1 Tax=Liquorilactobacillus nagelii TaxID=82688 RepID=UPI0039E83547
EPLSRLTVVTDQPTTSPIINDSVAAKQAADLMTNTTQPTTVKENSQLVTDMQEPLSRLTVVTDQPTTSPIVSNSVAAKQAADLTANTTQPTTVKGNAQSVATVQEPLSPATISTSQPITSPIINDSVAAKQMADLTANTTQPTTVKESAEPVTTLQAAKIMDSVDTKQKEVATDPALELVGSDISQQATSLVSQNSLNNFNTTDKSVESKDTTINMGIAGKVVTSKTDSKSLNLLTNTIETANSFVGNNNPLMDTTGATKQSFVWNTTNSAGQSQLVDNLAKEVSTMNIPGSKTVTIKLSPENLGNVEITMKTAQSQVSLAVKVQNTAAKELLGSVMDKLEQVLQNQPYSTDGSIGLKNANPVNQPNLTTAANTFFNFNSSQQQFAHQQPQHNFVGTSSKFANDTKKQTAEVQQHDLRKSTISILA